MKNLTVEQENKIHSRWKHWDQALNRLLNKNITKGRNYQKIFFKAQVMDCCLRYIDTGKLEDPGWSEQKKVIKNQKMLKNIENHQKSLVESAKLVLNNL